MSNRANVIRTKFVGLRTNTITYGVRVYDDYDCFYDNFMFESEKSIPDDDLELLKMIINEEDERIISILDGVLENQSSIWIDNEIYEWEQIKHLWNVEVK